jgi:phosphatidylethanolamine/phosphatidyl-N-methylethanolamine N-methyltransferase
MPLRPPPAGLNQHSMTGMETTHPARPLDAASVRQAYRRWAGVYDTVFGGISRPARARAVRAANALPPGRVLEVGVGTGLALPLYRPDISVVGIDLSAEMLARAREKVARERLANVEALHEMDAQALAFPDASFDHAVGMFVASVVPDAPAMLAELVRVVRPGGKILFVNHFRAEGGARWAVERAMAPFSRRLGWHPDFAEGGLLAGSPVRIEAREACPPFGLFTLLRLSTPR